MRGLLPFPRRISRTGRARRAERALSAPLSLDRFYWFIRRAGEHGMRLARIVALRAR
jgi:hypothetical protein